MAAAPDLPDPLCPVGCFSLNSHLRALIRWEVLAHEDGLMGREKQIAAQLAKFPGIRQVRIAFGDAGVMPYISQAVWLDPVGLNDSFIARERDRKHLTDYYFAWAADLVILGGRVDQGWFPAGHGPLGNRREWADDPRWNDYEYCGSCLIPDSLFDLQFYLHSASRWHDKLREYLRMNVVDGWYQPFPLFLGRKKTPPEPAQVQWVPASFR